MKKMWAWLKYAGVLMLDGYAVVVAANNAWPHVAPWIITALVFFLVL